MKRNTIQKLLVIGAVVIFLSIVAQPVTSIDKLQKTEAECDCQNVDKSGKSKCDELLEKINEIEQELEKISELLDQYEDNPILYRIIEFSRSILLFRTSFVFFLWGLYGCEFPD